LNVSAVLEGSVRRRGTGLRISARLIDARNGSELWSEMFDRELKDTVVVQEDISRAIIANLKAGPLLPAAAESTNRHVPPADAYHAYLKGRYMWSRVTPADFQKAVSQFEEAIALDPGYAPSYLALAQAYSGVATYASVVKPRDAWPQCKAMAEKALELDPTLGEAHTTLAGAKANYDWDQVGAEVEYKRGVELAPGSSIAHQFYASFLGSLKRWPEADAQMAEARRLDPLWNLGIWGDAQLYYWEGNLGEADKRVQQLIAREPDFVTAYALVAQIYFQQGRSRDAIRALEKAPDAVRQTARWVGSMGYLYAVTGNKNDAQKCLLALRDSAAHEVVSPLLAGMIYQALGDKDRAIQLITEALDQRLLRPGWIAVDPMFNPLRSDPRFQSLIGKVGL
jgi:adenylate cyclase